MSDSTTHLQLPFVLAAQAQKHVTVNESLLRLDALVQAVVVSATTTVQPGSPADGAIYLLPSGKTGTDWGPMANDALAYYRDGAWEAITPRAGWRVYVADTGKFYAYSGTAWAGFNAETATALRTARTLSISGDATGSASFDGSANAAIAATLANSGVTAGTYTKLTVDAKGRATAGAALASGDVTTALGYTPLNKAGDTISGNLGLGVTATERLHLDGNTLIEKSTEVFSTIKRTSAGAANAYIGNVQYCAKDSAGAYDTYFKLIVQQVDHMAGSEDSCVTFQGMSNGVLQTFLLHYGAGDYLTLNTGGSERVRLDSSGNLLVGLTTAAARLHVNGNARFDDSIEIMRTAGDAFIDFKDSGSDDYDCRIQQVSNGLRFATGGNGTAPERVRIKSTGSVRFVPLSSAPASPEAGDVYYDSTLSKLRCYDGAAWNNLY